MTRLALPVEEFILWAERLADLDWPISGEDFPQTISKFGWGRCQVVEATSSFWKASRGVR